MAICAGSAAVTVDVKRHEMPQPEYPGWDEQTKSAVWPLTPEGYLERDYQVCCPATWSFAEVVAFARRSYPAPTFRYYNDIDNPEDYGPIVACGDRPATHVHWLLTGKSDWFIPSEPVPLPPRLPLKDNRH